MSNLTILESAKLYGKHKSSLYRDIKNGTLSAKKIGKTTVINMAELIRAYGEPDQQEVAPRPMRQENLRQNEAAGEKVQLLEKYIKILEDQIAAYKEDKAQQLERERNLYTIISNLTNHRITQQPPEQPQPSAEQPQPTPPEQAQAVALRPMRQENLQQKEPVRELSEKPRKRSFLRRFLD